MTKCPWYKRFQVEIGGRWQAVPDRNTTFREWLFSPFVKFTYPGKCPVTRADIPEGEVFGGIESRADGKFESLILWMSCGIRVLGLDVGIGVFFRPKRSVNKLLKKGDNATCKH